MAQSIDLTGRTAATTVAEWRVDGGLIGGGHRLAELHSVKTDFQFFT